MGIFDQIIGGLGLEGLKESPELDKIRAMTKEALKSIKEDVNKGLEVNVLKFKAAFEKKWLLDYYEIFTEGVDSKGTPLKESNEASTLFAAIVWPETETILMQTTPQAKAINEYINKLENLPVLKDMIGAKNPKAKAEGWFKGLRERFPNFEWGFAWIGAALIEMADEGKKKNKEEDTLVGKIFRWLGELLGGKEKKVEKNKEKVEEIINKIKLPEGFTITSLKEVGEIDYSKEDEVIELKIKNSKKRDVGTLKITVGGKMTLELTDGKSFEAKDVKELNKHLADHLKPEPEAAEAETPEEGPERTHEEQQIVEKFAPFREELGVILDTANLRQNLQTLKKEKLDVADLINKGFSKTGKLRKVVDAIKGVPIKTFTYRLLDLRIQNFKPEQAEEIAKAIKDKKVKTDAISLRSFLDKIDQPAKIAGAIKENKETA